MYIFNIWIGGLHVFLVFRDFTPFFGDLGEYVSFITSYFDYYRYMHNNYDVVLYILTGHWHIILDT